MKKHGLNDRCFFDKLHITTAIHVFIALGAALIASILFCEILYFRKAIFVLAIPTLVIISTFVATIKNNPTYLWPFVGISFFHIFSCIYGLLIFSFYLIFKPLYIVMIYNWARKTMHSQMVPIIYLCSAALITILVLIIGLSIYQLQVTFKYIKHLHFINESLRLSQNPVKNELKNQGYEPQVLTIPVDCSNSSFISSSEVKRTIM
uniref:Uncharacterized protein n=1 Tax=Rhabditophanes sp. KR3021 TaxID=114890 RepID=A0AC35UE27_9BILA